MSDKRANDLNLFTKDQDNYSIDTSKKLKVGIIGTGWIAESHISEYLKMPDVELVGVADLVDGKAEEFLRKWNAPEGVRVYHSHKELIDNEELDAVSVCTYNMTHAECTIYALDHGVNVLLEKPMCVTLEEAVEIRKAEKRNGKIVSVGFQPRYNPNMQMIKYIIESGELGKVYHIQIGGGRRRGIPTPFGTTFIEKETGGIGALGDIGCYALDMVLNGMGYPKPLTVTGFLSDYFGKRPDTVRIFIAPPSWDALEQRLTGRGTDSPEKIQKRLVRAKVELQTADTYDYFVINDTVENAVREINAIMLAEHCKPAERMAILSE